MSQIYKLLGMSILKFTASIWLSALISCQSKNTPQQNPPQAPAINAQFNINSKTPKVSNQLLSLDQVSKCQIDLAKGKAVFRFTNSSTVTRLELNIDPLIATKLDYDCLQSSSSDNELFYQGCGVSLILAEQNSGKCGNLNQAYSMYRENSLIAPFSYLGTCKLSFSSLESPVVGQLNCTNLQQTHESGLAVQTLDVSALIDVSGSFSCKL